MSDLDQLSQSIDSLRVEFERFFNGAVPAPPTVLRDRVQASLRRLRDRSGSPYAERFRLSQLEARYNSFAELFNRRLRDQEEGRAAAPAERSLATDYDLAQGVVVGDSVPEAALAALYAGLGRDGAGRFDLETFRAYLDRQAAAIRAKTGCSQVRFRLVSEDGQTKLKARPMRTD